ncbi:MAG: hypothetical protein ACQEXJ_12745 [Myxococcota bacterium]
MPRTCTVAALALLLLGCSLPEGDTSSAEGVYHAALQARLAGDTDALWDLLHPEVRDLLERWHTAERRTRREIQVGYPSGQQDEALAALGLTRLREAEDARALFAGLMGRIDPPSLSFLERLGARARSVTETNGVAQVRTWAGDEVPVKRGEDGEWYAMPRPDELTRIRSAVRQAEANLDRVKRNVAIFSGRRTK